jgi:hypothetical protein
MSSGEQQIECRNCREVIPLDSGNCPNCGTSIRSLAAPGAAIGVGVLVAVGSMTNLGEYWFYGLVGIAMIGVGAFLIRNKRSRIRSV